MADPEMEFTIVGGDYYPISFRNDYLGRNDRVFDDDGINQALQADLSGLTVIGIISPEKPIHF